MTAEEMEFSLVKHYPLERRYITLKELKKPFLQALADLIFKRRK
ncbi:MAG: hypothetical protein QW590_01175 [Candidatus Bilamarchaeaceae archaeon]